MPLPVPILDDRSYQQVLRDELVRRIPVYAPEWTDHNASDPGITLIELFAFLGENLLYRFNQIPEATKLEFLRRLQIPLRKAQSARTLIAFTTKDEEGHLVDIHSKASAGKVQFETEEEVHAWPLAAIGAAKFKTAAPDPNDKEAWDFLQASQLAAELESNEVPAYYENKVVPPDPSAPGAPVVDFQFAVDGMLWVAVTETIGIRDPAQSKAARGRLSKALEGSVISVGVLFDENVPAMNEVDPCWGEGSVSTAPPMAWQISTTKAGEKPVFQTLNIVGDSTRGWTQQGVVRLMLPASMESVGLPPVSDPDAAGTGEQPPDLHDDKVSESLMFWLRAFRPESGAPGFGRVQWLGINAAGVIQSCATNPEFLGTGSAQPDQSFRLLKRDVIEPSLTLEVEESGTWTTWAPVEGFWSSSEDDCHYFLDAHSGEVKFGNGIHGRAPQIGERIRVRSYRYGGGPEGNVAAGAINKIEGVAGLKLLNPLAARGGAPAESIAEALDRLPAEFRRRDRAVTSGDFQDLALMTPGALVGRAECLPLFHPATPDLQAAGVVAVVVWPVEDSKNPNAPRPTTSLLASVCRWLDMRRLVTTELYVIPPTYRKVAVSLGVEVKAGFGIEAVRRWVELVVRQYLAPLPPFGPDGKGWPLGRRVYGPELEAAALQVEGVEFLYGLEVAGLGNDGNWSPGTVTLERYEVPELAEVTVVAGRDPIPHGVPINPAIPSIPIPIPVIKDSC